MGYINREMANKAFPLRKLYISSGLFFKICFASEHCTVSLVLAVMYLSDGCLPNICRTGLDPGRFQSPVGRRSRQLLAPAAVAAAAAVTAVEGPAASGAAATSVFWRKCCQLPPKKSAGREKSAKLLYSLKIQTWKFSLRCSRSCSAKIRKFVKSSHSVACTFCRSRFNKLKQTEAKKK